MGRVSASVESVLDGTHAQTSWLGLSVIAALSTLGLIAALGFEVWGAAGVPPSLRVEGPQAQTKHFALSPPGARLELDPLVFHHDVEPVLKSECWSCHGEAGAGEFRLRTGRGGLDLESVLPFVAPGRPEASLLLTKPLGNAWGGQPHSSSMTWKPDAPQVQLLERWIAGSSVPSRVTPEEESQ